MARSSEALKVDPAGAERSLYDRDFYGWAVQQAQLIRERRFAELDLENVAEEIESVGKSQRDALESNLARVIQHLLKWDYQPERRSPSGWHSVNSHRVRAGKILRVNPSLKAGLEEITVGAFEIAVADAMADTNLPRKTFPADCPYPYRDVMERVLEPVEPKVRR